MNLSPTTRHYLITFVAGAALAGMGDALTLFANGQPLTSWQPFAAAFGGGVILFGRDYLHNNTGAFLEGTAPAVVASVAAVSPPAPH